MPLEVDGGEYFSADEVAEQADVSRQTLWRWRQEGLVPAGRKYRRRRLLFSREDLKAILDFAHRLEPVELGRDAVDRGALRLQERETA